MNKRVKYLCYLAGAMEFASMKEMKSWREEVKEKLRPFGIVFYDPVEREGDKVHRNPKEQGEYIRGLKQAGKWDLFHEELRKIYWGSIDISKMDKMRILIYLNEKGKLEGNYETDLQYWGDFEAVARSSFIIVYYPKDVHTVGTIEECFIAYLLEIPIYLILPDSTKTECSSTLVDRAIMSGGQIFYSIKDCCDFIVDKYKLKEIKG
jgi:hypothetical protein